MRLSDEVKVRIGIIAADPLRALGLQTILQDVLNYSVVDLTLATAAMEHNLGALLLDADEDTETLLESIASLRKQRADIRIVALGRQLDPEFVQAVIAAGARGYLPHTASEGELRMALEVVTDGSVWAPRKVLARLIDAAGSPAPEIKNTPDRLIDQVTPREREVLDLLMEGRSNREIATSLNIDEVTVKAHLGRMLRKAAVSNRVELTLRALEEQGGASPNRKRTP